MKSRVNAAPSQTEWVLTCPWVPAAGPAMVFSTTSDPTALNSALAVTVVVSAASSARMRPLGVVDPGGVAVVEVDVLLSDGRLGGGLQDAEVGPSISTISGRGGTGPGRRWARSRRIGKHLGARRGPVAIPYWS